MGTAQLKAVPPASIGGLTDSLFQIREQKRKLEAKLSELDEQYREHEEALMHLLDEQGTDKGGGKFATCSVTSSVVADVKDWDELYKFVKRTGHFQLFQRRVSDPAFRELAERRGGVPGIVPFTKRKLNIRSK